MSEEKLPPTRQDWYDENRQLYEAETTQVPLAPPDPCPHYFERKDRNFFRCRSCRCEWQDNGRWLIEDGQIKRTA